MAKGGSMVKLNMFQKLLVKLKRSRGTCHLKKIKRKNK